MCGRFSLDPHNWEVADILKKLPPNFPTVKTGEVFPGDMCLAMANSGDGLRPFAMRWGFPRRDSKGLIINARSETASSRPLFRTAFKERRIALPSSGFFEWRARPDSSRKEKLLFTTEQGCLTWLAAIWSAFGVTDGGKEARFCILTKEASPFICQFHDRMPVVLGTDNLHDWLAGGAAPVSPPLVARTV